MKRIIDLILRGKAWKQYVETRLETQGIKIRALEEQIQELIAIKADQEKRIGLLRTELELWFERVIAAQLPELGRAEHVLAFARRDDELVIASLPYEETLKTPVGSALPAQIVDGIAPAKLGVQDC